MIELRVGVDRERDSALCCPRCVAIEGFDDAPDLTDVEQTEHEVPVSAIQPPRPDRETVRTIGRYCPDHEVLLPTSYQDASDYGLLDRNGDWIAAPVHTLTDYPIVIPVRLAEMVGDAT